MSLEATCFSSAAREMIRPPAFFASGAFSSRRWTLAGEQRDERARLFCRKLLKRLDGMQMPFYPVRGLMDLSTARAEWVRGESRWRPMESPFLDGTAIEFAHCEAVTLSPKAWALFAEVGFDVARLSSIPVVWGGFSSADLAGVFAVCDGEPRAPFVKDRRTYKARTGLELPYP